MYAESFGRGWEAAGTAAHHRNDGEEARRVSEVREREIEVERFRGREEWGMERGFEE